MYSYEINEVMKNSNYIIRNDEYLEICLNSPQIIRVTYRSFGDSFEIQTSDGWRWSFLVTNNMN